MATSENNPAIATATATSAAELEQTRRLAERYRCPFVDLREQRIDPELFRSIPAELMFRYNFVPLESRDTTL
jgi:type IV pilus assembly protein PilB